MTTRLPVRLAGRPSERAQLEGITVANSPFIVGERLYLRALEESDADGPYAAWLNDVEVCLGNAHHVFPSTHTDRLAYIRSTHGSRSALVLAIILKEGDLHIGNLSLQSIQWVPRKAEFAILLGDKEQWGRGYALEASRLIFRHGFSSLGLNRLESGVFATHPTVQKMVLKLGMRQEGVRRSAAFKNNAFVDVVEFGVLRDEFEVADRAL